MTGRLRREGGQDLIEFALILPVLLLLIIGIMQFGVAVFSYNTIANAAREGARYGTVLCSSFKPTCGATQFALIKAKARTLTTGLNQAALIITPSNPAGSIVVQVDYPVDVIPAIIGSPKINLRAVSKMQTE
jgi:Flp pilus assembly protein TadG